jgi:pyruvate kinase
VTLYRDVYPVWFDVTGIPYEDVTRAVLALLEARGVVGDGDRVMITKGDLHGHTGGTNGMKIVTVGAFVPRVG